MTMGLWGLITGAGKAGDVIDKGMDLLTMGAKGIDSLVHTSEEKAQEAIDILKSNVSQVVELAKLRQSESGASAVTRRLFGLICLGLFAVYAIVALVFAGLGKIEIVNLIIAVAEKLQIGYIAMTIIAGIFGYYTFKRK